MRVVFDLDGTLADISWRIHHIQKDKPDWDALVQSFLDHSERDTPLPGLDILKAMARDGHIVSIWTGRGEGENEIVRTETMRWLNRNRVYINPELAEGGMSNDQVVYVDNLVMRFHNDFTPDAELKRGWLHAARTLGQEPGLVFEDRDRVVKMYRDEGVPCVQVAPGDF